MSTWLGFVNIFRSTICIWKRSWPGSVGAKNRLSWLDERKVGDPPLNTIYLVTPDLSGVRNYARSTNISLIVLFCSFWKLCWITCTNWQKTTCILLLYLWTFGQLWPRGFSQWILSKWQQDCFCHSYDRLHMFFYFTITFAYLVMMNSIL